MRKKRKATIEANEIYTPNNQQYFYYPTLPDKCFTFKIRASNQAYLLLSSEQKYTEDSILITLGSRSTIRQNSTKLSYSLITPNCVNGKEFNNFWITWMDNGKIEVGKVKGSAFLKLQTHNMPTIKFIGITSTNRSDKWILEFDEPKCPDSNNMNTVQTICYETVESPNSLRLSSLNNRIIYQKYLQQQFQIDYEHFKNSKNYHLFTESYLKRLLQELEENFKSAKENHKKIIFNDSIYNDVPMEYLTDRIYDNIKNVFFEFYENVANQLNRYNKEERTITDFDNNINQFSKSGKIVDINDAFYKQPDLNLTKCSSEAVHPLSINDTVCQCKTGWAGNGLFCGTDLDGDNWPDKDLNCTDKYCKADNCPEISNHDQEDINADGIGDVCDFDMDGDGIQNDEDNCQKKSNRDQLDSDNDGIGDICDNCLNIKNSNQLDTDLDGIGNLCDDDIDNDDILNDKDNCKLIVNKDQLDSDNDGWGDKCDNCPNESNKNQTDIDFDNIGDVCDDDIDNDGIENSIDNCINLQNTNQTDTDNDGFGDECDNCPILINKEQTDNDNDGIGNECDNCPDVSNKNQSDIDDDKIGDLCDNCPTSNPNQEDHDHDLVGDACDNHKDTDRDGRQDNLDNCPNIANSNQLDSNLNGKGNACEENSEIIDKCPSNKTVISFSRIQVVNLDSHLIKSRAKNPNWKIVDYKIHQYTKSDPSLAVGYEYYGGVDYNGIVRVNTADDNGEIGLTFSYQSNRKFYLISWLKTSYKSKSSGLEIKLIDSSSGPGSKLREFLLLDDDTKQGKLIWRDDNKLGWLENINYKWELIHRPENGLIQLKIFDDNNKLIIDSGKLTDNTLRGGRLGLYTFNQSMVLWEDFHIKCNESKVEDDNNFIYDE